MEFWSKNFYILNRNTKAYDLKGGTLKKVLFKKNSSSTFTDLQSLLLNSNSLENNLNHVKALTISQFSKNKVLFCKTNSRLFFKTKIISFLINKQKNLKLIKGKLQKKVSKLFQFSKALNLFQRSASIRSTNTPILLNSNTTLDIFFKNTNLLSYVFTNSLLFKYLFSLTPTQLQISSPVLLLNLSNNLFPTQHSFFTKSNILTFHSFNYQLKRRVLKAFTYDTFSPNVTM